MCLYAGAALIVTAADLTEGIQTEALGSIGQTPQVELTI
jgi:hypothetical protein